MVEMLRRLPVGGDPGYKVAVGFTQQVFIEIKLSFGEGIQMSIGKVSQQKVRFLDAAMPASEFQALPANFNAFVLVNFRFDKARSVKSAHDLFCLFQDSAFAIRSGSAMFIIVYRISTGK